MSKPRSSLATRLIAALFIALVAAPGCGFRGPLYLPEETPPPAEPGTQSETEYPQAESTDEAGEDDRDEEDSPPGLRP